MSYRRTLSWSSALQDLRADRAQFAFGERAAHCRQAAFTKLAARRAQAFACARPLVVAGAYDRRAIMSCAVLAAKARRAITGEAWNVCLSAALRGTWQVAKAARSWFARHEKRQAEGRRIVGEPSGRLETEATTGEGGTLLPRNPSPLKTPDIRLGRQVTAAGGYVSAKQARVIPELARVERSTRA